MKEFIDKNQLYFDLVFIVSILNTKFWILHIYQALLKNIFFILRVIAAMSFSVRALNHLCILSITDLGTSRANLWRAIWVVNCWMACSIWFFNKCMCEKLTNFSPICSTRDFLKHIISNGSFVLSSKSTLLATTIVCNSTSTCLAFWPSITTTWYLRSCINLFVLSSLALCSARLFSNSNFCFSS